MPLLSACVHPSDFPENGTPTIKTQAELARLVTHPKLYMKQPFKLAGRIIRAESIKQDVVILAQWLPFPDDTFSGPELEEDSGEPRFVIRYSGTIDPDGIVQGNEFLVLGKGLGTQEIVTLEGMTRVVPVLRAQCLHIWKTAGTLLYEFIWSDPRDDRYPPPLEDTYCVQSS